MIKKIIMTLAAITVMSPMPLAIHGLFNMDCWTYNITRLIFALS